MVETLLLLLAVGYILPGVALAQLVWRDIDDGVQGTGHYVRAVAWLVLGWPKAIRDIRRSRR